MNKKNSYLEDITHKPYLLPVSPIKLEVTVCFVVQLWDFRTLISEKSEAVDGLNKH
jgi:hypothetical protein